MRIQSPILLASAFLCAVLAAQPAQAQLGQISAFAFDTLAPRQLESSISLQISANDKETNLHPDIVLLGSAQLRYIRQKTEYAFYMHQYWEQEDDGGYTRKTSLIFSPAINKFRIDADQALIPRRVWFEPIISFSANSDRGLRGELQLGALVSPWHYRNRWFGFMCGVGPVVSFGNWDMYNPEDIAGLSPEELDEINFINANLPLKRGRYYDFADIRATLYTVVAIQAARNLQFHLSSYVQYGFLNPYNSAIINAYPWLDRHYPRFVSELNASFAVWKDLAAKFSVRLDYERSLVVQYKSSFEYYAVMGLAWKFRTGVPKNNQ